MAQQVRTIGTKITTNRATLLLTVERRLAVMAIGAVMYGLLGWATSGLKIPGPFDSQIRPAVAIPLFFGAAFGPVTGFVTGALGNIVIDALVGTVYWNWSIGNGLMGLIAGLAFFRVRRIGSVKSLVTAVGFSLVGIVAGMAFASFTDIWVRPWAVQSLDDSWREFFVVSISNAVSAVVLVPLLGASFASLREADLDDDQPAGERAA